MTIIADSLRNIFNSVKLLGVKLSKEQATSEDFNQLMISLSDVYISVNYGQDEVRGHIDSALREIEKAMNTFERGDIYEEDWVGICLDMASLNIRAAIYFS
ncbi:hypothetical protein ZPAH1_orf00359 [Aeromonas phage ZPAH1]|nr:hypothetical protein ASwh1_313 [Aeromonas phage Aswh_1]QQG34121.1 hypothetical protein ZPAH1_orf00359 [Aeromonas phage ZPAH1]